MKLYMLTQRVLTCLGFLWLSHVAYGQVNWSIRANRDRQTLRAGDSIKVVLTANIDKEWHIASLTQPDGGPSRTEIVLGKNQPFKLATAIVAPKPKKQRSDAFDMDLETYEGAVAFNLLLQATADIPPGTKLTVNVTYQACSEESCMLPVTETLSASVSSRAAPVLGATAKP